MLKFSYEYLGGDRSLITSSLSNDEQYCKMLILFIV